VHSFRLYIVPILEEEGMIAIYYQVKRRFKSCFFIVMLLGAVIPLSAQAQENYKMRVVVFGDSVMAGRHLLPEEKFAARLQRRLSGIGFQVEVTDMSSEDETTWTAVDHTERVAQLHPDLVILQLGMNDVLRGMKPDNVYNNLHKVLYRLRYNELGNPTGTYIFFLGVAALPTQPFAYRTQLEQSLNNITEVHAVSYYPNVLEGIAGVPTLSLADGLHPNSEGINVLVENVLPTIDSLLRYRLQYLIQKSAIEQQQNAPQTGF